MTQSLPPGQGPIDPRGAFTPPPPPGGMPGMMPPVYPPTMLPQGVRPPAPWPPPPPPPRRGWGLTVFLTLLVLLLIGSVLLNGLLLVGIAVSSAGGKGGGQEIVLSAGDADQQIAVVPLEGVIDENVFAKFERLMNRAEQEKNVKALVLQIDTPGGGVTASDEIYQRVMRFKKNRPGLPVAVSMRALATSGGYYAACAADHLVAEETTLTGNIGVLLPRYNVSRLADKWGIEETTIVSSGAIYKNAGSMFRPENDKDTAYLQGIADQAFTRFRQVVSTGRSGKLKGNITDIANGKVYSAHEALQNGLIDEIGYLEEACSWAGAQAHLTKPNLVKYQEKVTLLDMLGAQSNVAGGKAQSRNVTVNGVNVSVTPELLDRIATPRLMYLWRGE